MIPDFNLEFDGIEYGVMGYVDSGSGYDWCVTALLIRKSDGAMFLASDSGCSCSYFGESNPIDKQVFSIEEALRECGDYLELKRSIETLEARYV